MYTMRHASEVRAMNAIDELNLVPAKIKPDEIKLAKQVIGNFETGGDLTQYQDDYQNELRRIIEAKVAGEEIVATAEEAPPKVVNLMEALRQSLERVSTNKKRAAKVASRPVRANGRATAKKRAAR
jgi:DNA end-binding protein Ku